MAVWFCLQCRQLVGVCDDILKSSPETLLTHTAQLQSVDLVPVSPGDQLVKPSLNPNPHLYEFRMLRTIVALTKCPILQHHDVYYNIW